MPVQVTVTPTPPVQIVGVYQAPAQVEIAVIPPVELVLKTNQQTSSNVDEVKNETPSGLINGINATYTSQYNFVAGTVQVYRNGLRLKQIDDFNTSGNNMILLSISPALGEKLLIDYQKL